MALRIGNGCSSLLDDSTLLLNFKIMKRIYFILSLAILVVVLILWCEPTAWAQCPMCKAAAESNLKEGGKHALGLNSGILYLLVTPYIIAISLGYWWWRNNKRAEAEP